MRPVFQWLYDRFVPALLALLAVCGLWIFGQQMEKPAFDFLMRLSARPAASPVVLVLIDDESIIRLRDRFGPTPWPRKAIADIFARVNRFHPSLMVFDGHFMNMNVIGDPAAFEEMIRFSNLITGLVMDESAGREAAGRLNTNVPGYYRLNLGVVNMKTDEDGRIRSIKPLYQGFSGREQAGVFPALSLTAAYEFLRATSPDRNWMMDIRRSRRPDTLHVHPETEPEKGIRLFLDAKDRLYLKWYRLVKSGNGEYDRSHEAIPLWRFFEASERAAPLQGRIALIGSSSTIYRDYHQTPMSHRHLGPDIHATAIDNILEGQTLRKLDPLPNLGILAVLGLLLVSLRLRLRHLGKTLLYTIGTMVIFLWLAFWLLKTRGIWIDIATPELFMMVAFLVGSAYRGLFKEKQLALMEENLARLVDPDVFREIRQRADVLKPGGQKLDITSMFVDIRNFTSFAERLSPAEVTELLNEFYADVVNVVFRHQGTIDKFMGDGILVIFGAPLPNERHREAALAAAADILDVTAQLSRSWQETKNITTDVGISVNSGPAFVGFLGPPGKLEYTAVGDTVNICVRLQEHTRSFGTRLIISEASLAVDMPEGDYIPLGEVPVRGREATIRIFTSAAASSQSLSD